MLTFVHLPVPLLSQATPPGPRTTPLVSSPMDHLCDNGHPSCILVMTGDDRHQPNTHLSNMQIAEKGFAKGNCKMRRSLTQKITFESV